MSKKSHTLKTGILFIVSSSLLPADFLVGQNVLDQRIELIDPFIDIVGIRTSQSNTATDFLDVFIDFKLWPILYPINRAPSKLGEVEFSWTISIDVDGNIFTGTGSEYPYPGIDFEIRSERIRDSLTSVNSAIGSAAMTSHLYQYNADTRAFTILPNVEVSESSLVSVPPPPLPPVNFFRLGCVVPGLNSNSRLAASSFLRKTFDPDLDFTEHNAETYFQLIKSNMSLSESDATFQIRGLVPQVEYLLSSSSNLRSWKLESRFRSKIPGEVITIKERLSQNPTFFRIEYPRNLNFP